MRRTVDGDHEKLDGSAWDHALLTSKLRTNRALAHVAGLSTSTVYAARAGRVPGAGAKTKIAKALGIDVDRLWVRVFDVEDVA